MMSSQQRAAGSQASGMDTRDWGLVLEMCVPGYMAAPQPQGLGAFRGY